MIVDSDQFPDEHTLHSDICVIGAGAAGIAIASRLANGRHSTCLLESGAIDLEETTQSLCQGDVTGRPYPELEFARARYFGGTTNFWSGWSRPLDAVDFEHRPYLPFSGWPITYDDIAPYYPAADRTCEIPFDSYQAQDFAGLIPEFFESPLTSARAEHCLWHQSTPTRFGQRYRDDLESAKNVQCVLHANVTELEPEKNGASVVRAHLVHANSRKRLYVKSRIFIVACGGIENARLLLLSDRYTPNGLGNDRDNVGRFFMLHPQVEVGDLLTDSPPAHFLATRTKAHDPVLRAGLRLSTPVQREQRLPNHGFLFHHRKGRHRNSEGYAALRHLIMGEHGDGHDRYDDLNTILDDLSGVFKDLAYKVTRNNANTHLVGLQARMDHLPNRDSRIFLSGNVDALGQRRICVHWNFSDDEKALLRQSTRALAEVLAEMGTGRVRLASWLMINDSRWPNHLIPDHHHMGTTRMSRDPAQGVVDENCRVHGVANLYVAGSSVFSTAGFSNPTLTIVALALRLADHISGNLEPG